MNKSKINILFFLFFMDLVTVKVIIVTMYWMITAYGQVK